jgi:outer membrane lipoprotein carrier protein
MKVGWILISVFAGLLASTDEGSPAASTLIHRFELTYRSSKTLQANFLETYFDGGKVVRSEAGVAYFAKPGKMRWEYESPEPNLYIVDGKWAWFYVPADHTVTRSRAKLSGDTRTPLALLAGEMKVSRICKSVALARWPGETASSGVALRCNLRGSEDASTGKSSAGVYALLELNSQNGELIRILAVDPGGVQVEYRFSKWQFDPQLLASKFSFLPSKGVAIVDGDLGARSGTEDGSPGR